MFPYTFGEFSWRYAQWSVRQRCQKEKSYLLQGDFVSTQQAFEHNQDNSNFGCYFLVQHVAFLHTRFSCECIKNLPSCCWCCCLIPTLYLTILHLAPESLGTTIGKPCMLLTRQKNIATRWYKMILVFLFICMSEYTHVR